MSDIIGNRDKFSVGWVGGLPETPCGSGSKIENTAKQREWIPKIVEKYNIRSVVDVGAGDLNWIKLLKWEVEYTPLDLVPRTPEVIEFDLVKDVPPKADMIMCLWMLNHLPFDHCRMALKNIMNSGAEYLLMTHRPIWLKEQPPEIDMPYLEKIVLNKKEDQIRLIKL